LITSDDLATLQVRRVIFHDIPRVGRGVREGVGPILSETETVIDPSRREHLRNKLTRVLSSKSAYPISFNPQSESPVPNQIRSFTKKHHTHEEFVKMSQTLARYLFEQQNGAISAGLLCVLDAVVRQSATLVFMKLEREEGARLELIQHKGKQTFDMSVLDNLVLTDGTRLFKTAAFIRLGKGDDDFRSAACDAQLKVVSSDDMAKFWLRFLGCVPTVEPRVATQRFYESTVRFINQVVTDPVQKNELYEHLQSQLRAPKRQFSPRSFIEEYVPEDFHRSFREYLQAERVPLTTFTKDLADIEGRLRRTLYVTRHGAVVTVPSENPEIVVVHPEQIIVNDSLTSVDKK
jgi:hypothetical protein